MKLKKVVSLALAGVLAVSMLAGCAGKDNGAANNGTEATESTSVVEAVNNGQSANNKVKVTFKSDAKLDEALTTLVELGSNDAIGDIEKMTSYDEVLPNKGASKDNPLLGVRDAADVEKYLKTGMKYTDIEVISLAALSKEAALNMAADMVDDYVGKLVDTTYKKDVTLNKEKYADYSYDGVVSLVSTENYGFTTYYLAFVVNQTVTVNTLEK